MQAQDQLALAALKERAKRCETHQRRQAKSKRSAQDTERNLRVKVGQKDRNSERENASEQASKQCKTKIPKTPKQRWGKGSASPSEKCKASGQRELHRRKDSVSPLAVQMLCDNPVRDSMKPFSAPMSFDNPAKVSV